MKQTAQLVAALGLVVGVLGGGARVQAAPFKVFMVASTASDHLAMTAQARISLATVGAANDFTVDFTDDPSKINDANLAQYQVFLQMHLAPFEINLEQRLALERFVAQGKGWVGVHGAGLIIPESYVKRNYPNWDFYSKLIGGLVWVTHPALQNGTLIVEDRTHPATKNLPATFQIRDEWYEWDKNPRANVRVLARADEKTYTQVKPAGDHPLVWSYEGFPRAIYIGIGHDASDWSNANFSNLVRDALLWASTGAAVPVDGGADVSDGGPSEMPAGSGGASGSGGAVGSGGASGSGGAVGSGGASGSGGQSSAGSGGASGSGGSAPSTNGGGGCAVATAPPTVVPALIGLALVLSCRCRRR